MSFFTAPRLLATLALAAAALPAVSQAAEPAYETHVQVVSTAGLNLAQSPDQAILRHRIAVAAYRVCSQVVQGDPLNSPGYAECFAKATADARAQMQNQIASANTRSFIASISK